MDELKTKVYEAIGAASMCWDPRPNSQIFESDRAKEIGDALFAAIETELAASRRQLARADHMVLMAEKYMRCSTTHNDRHEDDLIEAIKAYRAAHDGSREHSEREGGE